MARTNERETVFLPRPEVNAIMGFAPGNLFFGFNGGKGIAQIDQELYGRLLQAARENAVSAQRDG
jgi:hypothetical protein